MQGSNTNRQTEGRLLAAITLPCYITTLAALLAMSYSIFTLAARGLDENIFAAYSRQMF